MCRGLSKYGLNFKICSQYRNMKFRPSALDKFTWKVKNVDRETSKISKDGRDRV